MVGRKNAEKELRWREMLERYADSKVSVREFCTSEGVSEPSFYAWRKKLGMRKDDSARARPARRRKDRSRTVVQETAKGNQDRSDNGRLFVPLQVLDTAATLEIIHPLGYRIQVTGDVNPVALRQVIEVLDERGGR